MDEMIITTTDSTSSRLDKVLFSAGTTGYRIFRLSMEVFLVEHIIAKEFPVPTAGTIFLLYSLADVITAMSFLWFPTLWFGSRIRGVLFLLVSVSAIAGGFVCLFLVESFSFLASAAIVCGVGTGTWFVNYQTLTNTAFSKKSMSQVAKMRQLAECVGFLFPGICLAIIKSVESTFSTETIIVLNAIVLAFIGVISFLASAPVVSRAAADVAPSGLVRTESVVEAVKVFCLSKAFNYFILNSILISISNVMFATLSTTTKSYFGLDPELLWLAAIGFPLGGMMWVVSTASCGGLTRDDRQNVRANTMGIALLFSLFLSISQPVMNKVNEDGKSVAKVALFFLGSACGVLYSGAFTAAFALWLKELKDQSPEFVARANVLHNAGVQLFIAGTFQAQTVLLGFAEENNVSNLAEASILFAPIVLLCTMALAVTTRIPLEPDPKFGWPVRTPFNWFCRFKIWAVATVGVGKVEDLAFAVFCDFRTSLFGRYLENSSIQQGCLVSNNAFLCPEDLRTHLQCFDALQTREEWFQSSAKLRKILTSNQVAFRERLDLVKRAESSIWLLTWAFNDRSGKLLAEKLVERAQAGVNVRVIVDAINLFYLDAKRVCIDSAESLDILEFMSQGGVQVHMLDTWHNDDTTKDPYVIGSHRKVLMVDNKYMMTGGRNIDDHYALHEGQEETFHFQDVDIILELSSSSTEELLESFWDRSKSLLPLFGGKCEVEPVEEDTEQDSASFLCDDPRGRREPRSRRSLVFRNSWQSSMERLDEAVSLFQLNHEAGDINGYDIIMESLVFLIDTANASIDLFFGYFQMFPCVEEALRRAIVERGVRVRLVTNSRETNDLFFFDEVFRTAYMTLLDLGAEVYVPSKGSKYCFHSKYALVDSRVLLIGSWNCNGTSVFYDAEYSVVLFGEDGGTFAPLNHFFEDSISQELLVQMETAPESKPLPLLHKLSISKYALSQVRRGF